MTDRDGENEAKGFKGLQSLGAAKYARPDPDLEAAAPPKPTPRQEPSSPALQGPGPDAQLARSQTAPPAWRPWVIGLGVLAAFVLVVAWIGSQSPGDAYSTAAAADSASKESAAPTAEAVPEPTITPPPVGSGLVLTSDQIRYCVFEDRRIKAAETLVDNYNEYSVNTFNAMVEDYNSRCSNFRYRQGALAPIEAEANAIQTRLEQEGRQRMLGGQSSTTSAAEVLPDPMTAAPSSSGPITEPYGASKMAGDSTFGASEGGVPPEEATNPEVADSVPAAADAAASDDPSDDPQESTDE